MQLIIDLPEREPGEGYLFQWEDGFEIKVTAGEQISILANGAGLVSLAKQLLYLAQDTFPRGYHLHYDEYNSLEDGSKPLLIEKC